VDMGVFKHGERRSKKKKEPKKKRKKLKEEKKKRRKEEKKKRRTEEKKKRRKEEKKKVYISPRISFCPVQCLGIDRAVLAKRCYCGDRSHCVRPVKGKNEKQKGGKKKENKLK
jgi:hypothetical protein